MKRKKLVFAGILLLFVAPIIVAEDQKKEISANEAMKYYCKTWRNPAYDESSRSTGIKIMNKDGTFHWLSNENSPKNTGWLGKFKIEKGWIDKDGNVWLHMIYDVAGYTKYTVAKISDDGNTLEQVYLLGEYPTDVNPDALSYFIMYKK
jgi:hypothetical protein